jgi:hypothetical protein
MWLKRRCQLGSSWRRTKVLRLRLCCHPYCFCSARLCVCVCVRVCVAAGHLAQVGPALAWRERAGVRMQQTGGAGSYVPRKTLTRTQIDALYTERIGERESARARERE